MLLLAARLSSPLCSFANANASLQAFCQIERALSRSDLPIEQGPRGLGTLARTPNPLKEVGTVD
jgi:hypothetical protein